MTECQFCHAKLVTDGLVPGQQLRCANCQSFSRIGKVDKVATDKLAWRSFWLGISSIFLLTITGLPAIYYGIRSLLRMRFGRPERGDKAAAITGTMLGGFFGVIVGFVVVCTALVLLLRFTMTSETFDAAAVKQRSSEFFEFSNSDFIPNRAATAFNSQYVFEFGDQASDPENPNPREKLKSVVSLVYLRNSLQSNPQVMSQILRPKYLGRQRLDNRKKEGTFEWNVGGETVDVTKVTFSGDAEAGEPDSPVQGVQFFGSIQKENGMYGVSLLYDPNHYQYSLEEIQAIIESVKLLE